MNLAEPDAPTQQRPTRTKIAWAACLGFFIPGLGQIYSNAWERGVLLLALQFGFAIAVFIFLTFAHPTILDLIFLAGAIVLICGFRIWSAYDAAKQARIIRPYLKRPRYKSTWTAFLLSLLLSAVLPSHPKPVGWDAFCTASSQSGTPTLLPGDCGLTTPVHAGDGLQR